MTKSFLASSYRILIEEELTFAAIILGCLTPWRSRRLPAVPLVNKSLWRGYFQTRSIFLSVAFFLLCI